jgi:hypothetical protein
MANCKLNEHAPLKSADCHIWTQDHCSFGSSKQLTKTECGVSVIATAINAVPALKHHYRPAHYPVAILFIITYNWDKQGV